MISRERGPKALLERFRYLCGVRAYVNQLGEDYIETPTELSKLVACPLCQSIWWGAIATAAYTLLGQLIVWLALPLTGYLLTLVVATIVAEKSGR